MDGELERYHKTNSGLDLTISNLRLKQAGLASEVLVQRGAKADTGRLLERLQHDLAATAAHIQEPKALKERVKALYHKYCARPGDSTAPTIKAGVVGGGGGAYGGNDHLNGSGDIGGGGGGIPGADIEREAARQREYLEKTVDSLKRKLAKDSELHRTDNLRIMQVKYVGVGVCVCVDPEVTARLLPCTRSVADSTPRGHAVCRRTQP
jgi:cilia- and flagella-associated protein 57